MEWIQARFTIFHFLSIINTDIFFTCEELIEEAIQ